MPTAGTTLGPYEIDSLIGAGGPAFARVGGVRALRRGFAAAKPRSTR